MSINSFDARTTLEVAGTSYEIFALDTVPGSDTLPVRLKVLRENLWRTGDGRTVRSSSPRPG